MIQPVQSVVLRQTLPSVQGSTLVVAGAVALTLVCAPLLLLFAAQAVSQPALWAAHPGLLVPELLFMALSSVAALMALLSLAGVRRAPADASQRAAAWMMVGLMGGAMQIVYALAVQAVNCG